MTVNLKLGMLVPEFPTQTHVFFWREIETLRELGVETHILSTRRPKESCPHSFGVEAAGQTHYLYPPQPRALWQSLGGAWRGYGRALEYVGGLSEIGGRAQALGYMLCAGDLY